MMYGLKQYGRFLVLAMAFVPQIVRADIDQEIFSVHGSGTTNPSKCFWNIMSKIEDQSHAFTRLTYRAVGSGTGQFEFMGVGTEALTPKPANNFGSGDIPLSSKDYDNLKVNGASTVVHLPFVVSGVSFFHSVPNVPQGKGGLNLTSCLLAQIFSGSIDTWNHPDIVEQNPNLPAMLPSKTFPITVAHRVEGSSSTQSITEYLNGKCSKYWPLDMVKKEGKQITWAPDALACDSSGQMTACIRGKQGTIGYIDAGHGWDEGLNEIELQNADNKFVSSMDSFKSGGTGDAAIVATRDITSFDESFADVSLLDQKGENTWPILVMSYIYVRTNINEYMTNANLGLLEIFLKAMYDPYYIDECKNFGFTPVPDEVRNKALKAISNKVAFNQNEPWTFEVETRKIAGQGTKVISRKRRDYGEYERSKLSKLVGGVITSDDNSSGKGKNHDSLDQRLKDIETLLNDNTTADEDAQSNVTIALVFSILSFASWCAVALYMLVTKCLLNM